MQCLNLHLTGMSWQNAEEWRTIGRKNWMKREGCWSWSAGWDRDRWVRALETGCLINCCRHLHLFGESYPAADNLSLLSGLSDTWIKSKWTWNSLCYRHNSSLKFTQIYFKTCYTVLQFIFKLFSIYAKRCLSNIIKIWIKYSKYYNDWVFFLLILSYF